MNRISFLLLVIYFFSETGCKQYKTQENRRLADHLNEVLTEAIIHDGFNPPVASRIYAYCNIAAYQATYYADSSLGSLNGKLHGLQFSEPQRQELKKLCEEVVLIKVFRNIATELVYRDFIIEAFADSLLKIYTDQLSKEQFTASVNYADRLTEQLLVWMKKDNYKETRTMSRFQVGDELHNWQPTAPNYGEAIEPHFYKIRTIVLDSSSQFQVKDYDAFGIDTLTDFFRIQVKETYQLRNSADSNALHYALFWDCNPQKTTATGHIMYNTRQLTPGGHWVAIASKACREHNVSLAQSTHVYALTSIALFDAFNSCWNEKYRSNFIRPETWIRKYYDISWTPILETPNFPEHPSGHSVVSAAAATVLTDFFGSEYSFIDSSEVPFGIQPRSFSSFRQAADEAAQSRVVAGIHFPLARDEGKMLGNRVGKEVIKRLSKDRLN